MKNKLLILLTTVIAAFAITSVVYASSVPKKVEKAAEAAVRISIKTNFGTEDVLGFAIGKGFRADHVVTSLKNVEGSLGDILVGGTEEENIRAELILTDSKRNIAVLKLDEELEIKPSVIADKKINDGARVYTTQYYAKNNPDAVKEGSIQSHKSVANGEFSSDVYQISAQVSRSNNGGPLFDKSGNVVGVCYYDGNTNENKALVSQELCKLLDDNDIDYAKATILYLVLLVMLILLAIAAATNKLLQILKTKKENAPMLVGTSGEFEGQKMPVTAENITIGRDAKSCQIVILSDTKVSRCHCSVRYDKMRNKFVLTDLSSTHGTYTNQGQKLEANVATYIASGTVFSLGSEATSFKVVEGGMY